MPTAVPPVTSARSVPTTSVAVPQPVPPAPGSTSVPGLQLTPVAVAPGGTVTAAGMGCAPQAPVELTIGDTRVGGTVADPDGVFRTPLTLAAVAVGRHDVTAKCGPTLAASLDVVLAGSVGTDSATLTVILFFLLLGGWFYGHRLISHLPERRRM